MTIDSYISILSNENDTLDKEDRNQIIEWLEELKELRKLKEIYAKGMETSYAEYRYQKGRVDMCQDIINRLFQFNFDTNRDLDIVMDVIKEQVKE